MPEDVGDIAQSAPPIIVKRIKKGGHGHHGGAWKVAYADMVTALMALFIVLWILGQSEEVIRNVAGYFRDPVGFLDGGAASIIEGQPEGAAIDLGMAAPLPAPSLPVSAPDPSEAWREQAGSIREVLEDLPSFDRYRDQVEFALSPEGLRVTLIESSESPLFQVGGTELNPEAVALLATLSRELARLPHPIAIEGHTDSRPFGADAEMTNWELSTGRSHTARRLLEAGGVAPERVVEVQGFADRRLYNPQDPEDSRNRRIAITLLSDAAVSDRLDSTEEVLGDPFRP